MENQSRPKKRSRQPNLWKHNVIKASKARGLQHVTHYGNVLKPARQVQNAGCDHNCQQKVSKNEKLWVLDKFNAIADHTAQNIYLQSCTIPLPNGRHDYICQLPQRIEVVCQKYFLSLHDIKRSRLRRKVLNRNVPIEDGRGKHTHYRRVCAEYLDITRSSIENLDSRPSHYSRNSNPNKTYLESNVTIKSLHDQLIQENPQLNPAIHANGIKLSKFSQIFNYEYNIGFGLPRSDICDFCEFLKAKIQAAQLANDEELLFNLYLQQQEHWMQADHFFKKMSRVTLRLTDNSHADICFDFEKNVPLPVTNIGKEFYLRQLWLHNFGIRDLRSGDTYLFTYAEHFAKKGSTEVVSFLKYYIENVVPEHIRHLHLFSDNSYGQNKNRFLLAYLRSLCPSRFETISFDLPLPGHSRMLIDSDFAHIEKRKRRNDKIYYPSQWVNLMRNSRISNPFQIIYVQHPLTDDLTEDGTPICNVYNFKETINPLLLPSQGKIAQLRRVTYSENGMLFTNETDKEATLPFRLLRPGITQEILQETIRNTPLAYNGYLPISAAKFANLQVLLQAFHRSPNVTFYDTITAET